MAAPYSGPSPTRSARMIGSRPCPVAGASLSAPATVYYDDHLVPFIEAASDDDLAFCLGLVQAHLRLAQMEIFRLASQGRLAEMAGPFMTEVDKSIRILGLDRAVAEMEKTLPPETKQWLDRYIAGINHCLARGSRPPEFELLGLDPEPWAVRDVLILGPVVRGRRELVLLFPAARVAQRGRLEPGLGSSRGGRGSERGQLHRRRPVRSAPGDEPVGEQFGRRLGRPVGPRRGDDSVRPPRRPDDPQHVAHRRGQVAVLSPGRG